MVTVLTPTYNRKEFLLRLFHSLLLQEDKEFLWLVVDDGSTDGTEGMVEECKEKAPFIIQYMKKQNGGKHTALNFAYQYITTPLTFIVDSDDWLSSDAVLTINATYKRYKDETDLCGFSFLRGKPKGGYLSTSGVPRDGMKETFVECRLNRRIAGDMAEVWYTHCLKEYPFPEYENEKFLGEDISWIKMSEKYKVRFFNKVIYMSEYLEGGLTNNRRKNNISSPRGCMARAEVFLLSDANAEIKIKSMLQYYIYGRFAGVKTIELLKKVPNKALFVLCLIPAQGIYLKWKSKY